MNWTVLKALNDLYLNGEVNKKEILAKSGEMAFLVDSLQVVQAVAKKYQKSDGFDEVYVDKYLLNYNSYYRFLTENKLLKQQSRYEEHDIRTLMRVSELKKQGGLDSLRQQIIDCDESLRGISQMFFINDKYLDNRPSLVEAMKVILEIPHFALEKDQQYMYRLECDNPVAIVLCENLDFLTKPNKPRRYGIELWYAGGKNVTKLQYADTRGLPVYYSCDWDYDGIFVIFPLVKQVLAGIILLTPNGPHRGIKDTEHASHWNGGRTMDDFKHVHLFEEKQQEIIGNLVKADQWIIEESNDLFKMLGI